VPYLLLSRPGILGKQRERGEDHRRGAVPALQTLVLDKAFLDRVKLVRAGLNALDGEDLVPVDIGRQQAA
jgi:hypothetical protein